MFNILIHFSFLFFNFFNFLIFFYFFKNEKRKKKHSEKEQKNFEKRKKTERKTFQYSKNETKIIHFEWKRNKWIRLMNKNNRTQSKIEFQKIK